MKASIVDKDTGLTLASDFYPKEEAAIKAVRPGWAEQNPDDLTAAVEKVIHDAAERAKSLGGQVLAVSFSNANQSVILLDKNHQRLTRAMTWADTRAREVAAKLKATPDGADIYAQTGTPIHPMSPLTKLMWLKQTQPEKNGSCRICCRH